MDGGKLALFIFIMALVGFVAYNVMVTTTKRRWFFIAPLLISHISLLVIRYWLEGGNPADAFILDPRVQSWALLFGDPGFIPTALLGATYAWPSRPAAIGWWFHGKGWYWTSLACGYALAAFWNLVLDAPNYVKAGHGDLLLSPSHLWHGWVTFPVLSAALINYGVPVILKWWRSKAAVVFFIGLAGYIAMSVADATIHPLDVTNLHPPVSQTWLAADE